MSGIAGSLKLQLQPRRPLYTIDEPEQQDSSTAKDTKNELRRRQVKVMLWLRHPTRRLRIVYSLLFILALYATLFRHFSVSPSSIIGEPFQTAMGKAATPQAAAARHNERKALPNVPLPNTPPPPSAHGVRVPLPELKSRHPVVNGRLEVDPSSSAHPIHQLIQDARHAWDTKVAKQSRTLSQAVDEYRRRYKRSPPRGFDKWWQYVVDNNVQLPDEYDQLERDLHLFWALQPRDLKQRIEAASRRDDTFTIKIRGGTIRTSGRFGKDEKIHRRRRDGQFALVQEIAQYIPDMEAVYTTHDTPWNLLSWGHRQALLEFIEDGEYVDVSEEHADHTYTGWKAACPVGSPVHRMDSDAPLPSPPDAVADKSFISDLRASMDVCQNPSYIRLHGFLTGKNPVDEPLSAMFSISKTSLHGDILGVPPERVTADASSLPWSDKTHNRLLWRGTNTGMHYSARLAWRDTHRIRLMALGAETAGSKTVLPPPAGLDGPLSDASSTVAKSKANAHYFDMGFVGGPIQCETPDGTCDEIRANYPFKEYVKADDAKKHKYIIDVDGNGWSARFQGLMSTGSLIFKSTIMPEWWNDRIQPWVHFIPVKLDYSDLHDSLAFFAGDVDGLGGDDELAQEIANQGKEWAAKFYRKEDMTAYVFRLYLEWARLQAPNRGAMVFDVSEEFLVGVYE